MTSAGDPAMPPDLVTGDDVDSVAAYVASVAGVPGAAAAPPGGGQADGKSIFTENCAGCHARRCRHDGHGRAESRPGEAAEGRSSSTV